MDFRIWRARVPALQSVWPGPETKGFHSPGNLPYYHPTGVCKNRGEHMEPFRSRCRHEVLILLMSIVLSAAIFRSDQAPGAAPSSAQGPDERHLLLHPEALKAAPPSATVEEIRQHFLDPPAEFRTAPLWVWNDGMNAERIKEQLRQFKEQGIGQVFVHPRPGLITEYLGNEWFELWNVALAESKRLGLLCNIYDENSYPSGFA